MSKEGVVQDREEIVVCGFVEKGKSQSGNVTGGGGFREGREAHLDGRVSSGMDGGFGFE